MVGYAHRACSLVVVVVVGCWSGGGGGGREFCQVIPNLTLVIMNDLPINEYLGCGFRKADVENGRPPLAEVL